MTNKNKQLEKEQKAHFAYAKSGNLPISSKQCIEICRNLRYKNTGWAKRYLEEVIVLKRAVPFRRFLMDMGHKPGMSSGRFPQKAAKEVLSLIKSVEANAQAKGLNTSTLKISKIVANKASIPLTGGRHRTGTKRANLEIEVKEMPALKKRETKQQKEKTTKKSVKKKETTEEKKEGKKTNEAKENKETVSKVTETKIPTENKVVPENQVGENKE